MCLCGGEMAMSIKGRMTSEWILPDGIEKFRVKKQNEKSKNLRGCDGAEPFLPSSVPDLQFDSYAIDL